LTSEPLGTCTIRQAKDRHFPDLTFNPNALGLGVGCFSTTLTNATLDGIPVTATAYSGVTDTSMAAQGRLKAATMLIVRNAANTIELGRVYSQDIIDLVLEMESLTMVSGTRSYKGGHGNFTLEGNALNPVVPTQLRGTLCIEN
jgi:hypothetical protein